MAIYNLRSNFNDFSESPEKTLKDGVFSFKSLKQPIFNEFTHLYIAHAFVSILVHFGPFHNLDLTMLFDRAF